MTTTSTNKPVLHSVLSFAAQLYWAYILLVLGSMAFFGAVALILAFPWVGVVAAALLAGPIVFGIQDMFRIRSIRKAQRARQQYYEALRARERYEKRQWDYNERLWREELSA